VAHASATHSVAVLSLPALGPVAVAGRALDTIVRLVAALLTGDHDHTARELGQRVKLEQGAVRVVAGVLSGNLRLLLGMLRANRPWRLAVRLSRLLVAAVAVGVFALVTGDGGARFTPAVQRAAAMVSAEAGGGAGRPPPSARRDPHRPRRVAPGVNDGRASRARGSPVGSFTGHRR
jgi:hypothetical protein